MASMCAVVPEQTTAILTLALTFDSLTSGLMHAQGLPWTDYIPTWQLIAQSVFLFLHGQTYRYTN